jgi:SrtB family sortase
MQETPRRKKSSPQTRLLSGLLSVALFAGAFTLSFGLLTDKADAQVAPPVNTKPQAATPAPDTVPFGENVRFMVDIGPYQPVKPLASGPIVSPVSVDTTPAAETPLSSAPASSSPASGTPASSAPAASAPASSAPASTTPVGYDPKTLGATGFANIPSWKAVNSDVVGWLRIPNTNIDYPVVHHPDVNYYMARDVYKNNSRNGVIWADGEAQFGPGKSTRNTVLYGHNWTNISRNPRIGNPNDVMFAQLTAFQHLSFAQRTPYIHFSTAEQEQTWVVFAAFYTDIDFYYIACFPDDTLFAEIVTGAKARSEHIYDVEVAYSDRIITLSTCTRAFGPSANQRFVVMARALRPGESTETAPTIVTNPSPIRPVL